MPRKLPPFCVEDVDRYGNVRIYLRRKGLKKIRLEGVPWSTEFMDAYAAALSAGDVSAETRIVRSKEGTWRWLCEQYLGRFAGYLQMTPATRAAYRRFLEATYDEPISPGNAVLFRDVPIKVMSAKAIRTLRDRHLAKPSIANATLKAIRQVFVFAVEDELVLDNPAVKVPFLKAPTDGHHTWTKEETLKFEQRHPIGTQAHLAYALLLYTGARVSDVRLFGRQHISEGWLLFRPSKTSRSSGVEVEIPILPALQAVLDQSKADNLTFLTTHQHKPYSAKGLTNRMRDWCDEAGLPQCSAHGLRKAGATIAAENGASERQLMAIYGWTEAEQAAKYTRKASRKKLAGEAMSLINRG
jgi:integrase